MEVKISMLKDVNKPEEKLTISTSNQTVTIDGTQQYSAKTLRYIVDQIVKRFISDKFVSLRIAVNSHTAVKASPVTQPTGEATTVIKKFDENNYIEDEYIFIDDACVFNNGADINDKIVMGNIVREYVEKIFFSEK